MAPGCHVVGIEDQVAVKVLKQKDLYQEDSGVGHVSSSFFGMKPQHPLLDIWISDTLKDQATSFWELAQFWTSSIVSP